MQPRIVIADDHPIILLGAQIIVEKHSAGIIVGKADSSEQLDLILKDKPCELLLTDFSMPHSKCDGIAMLKHVRELYPKLKIIVFTSLQNPAMILNILKIGVRGVVEKNAAHDELIIAIKTVMSDKIYISHYFRQCLANESILSPEKNPIKLTSKELEIIRLLATGMTQLEIANKLFKSVKTVSCTKISAKNKLGITTDLQLYQFAKSTNLIN